MTVTSDFLRAQRQARREDRRKVAKALIAGIEQAGLDRRPLQINRVQAELLIECIDDLDTPGDALLDLREKAAQLLEEDHA